MGSPAVGYRGDFRGRYPSSGRTSWRSPKEHRSAARLRIGVAVRNMTPATTATKRGRLAVRRANSNREHSRCPPSRGESVKDSPQLCKQRKTISSSESGAESRIEYGGLVGGWPRPPRSFTPEGCSPKLPLGRVSSCQAVLFFFVLLACQ
jgi:hypothetical protein